MPTNELTTEMKVGVIFNPSTIEIQNEENLQQYVDEKVAFYGSLVFSEENMAEAKQSRTELNKIKNMLDDERKKVKSEFQKPLTEFERKIKKYTSQLALVIDGIKQDIDSFESKQTAIRLEKLQELISEMMVSHNLTDDDLKDFEIDKSWYNATAFTKKGEPSKKTIEAIHNKLGYIDLQKQQILSSKQAVKEFAELSGLDPYAWENLIDRGLTTADVIEKIKQSVEQKRLDLEEKERQRIAKEEYDSAMSKLAKEQFSKVNDTTIDMETGEVIKVQEQFEPEILTFVLEVTGTYEALASMNEFMKQNDISFRKVAK
jgi:hypothetical protein